MSIKKISILLYVASIGSILLISCNSITGHWESKNKWISLNLNKDSTYSYCFTDFDEHVKYHSSGQWIKGKGQMILNSHIKNNAVPLEISYNKFNNNKQLCIVVVLSVFNNNDLNENGYVCEPFSNDFTPLRKQITADEVFRSIQNETDPYVGRYGSYIIYSDILIDSIWFNISRPFYTSPPFIDFPIQTEHKKLNCSLGDSLVITININDFLFNYKVFTDKILKVKNKNIILENADKLKFIKLIKNK